MVEHSLLQINDCVGCYYNGKAASREFIVRVTGKQAYGDLGNKFRRTISLGGELKSIFYQGSAKFFLLTGDAAIKFSEDETHTKIVKRILDLVEKLQNTGFVGIMNEELLELENQLTKFKGR